MSINEVGKTIKTWMSLIATVFVLGVAWNTYGSRLMNVESQAENTVKALSETNRAHKEEIKAVEIAFSNYQISNASEHTDIKIDIARFSTKQEIFIKQQDKILDKLDVIQGQINK